MLVARIIVLLLLLVAPASLAQEAESEEPQPASLTILFTNNGAVLEQVDRAKFYIYDPGKRKKYIDWGHSAKTAHFEEGTYDIVVRYKYGDIVEERVREEVELTGDIIEDLELGIPIAELTLAITSGGRPIEPYAGSYTIYRAGRRDKPIARKRPGESAIIRPGVYDIDVAYRDFEGLKRQWLESYAVDGVLNESVEIGLAAAELTVTLLERGQPVEASRGRWRIYKSGERRAYIAERRSGETLSIEGGEYDIGLFYRSGGSFVERWLVGERIDDLSERRVEMGAAPSSLTVNIRDRGSLLAGSWFTVYRAGERGAALRSAPSGASIHLDPGTYDIGCFLHDGGTRAEKWVEGYEITGFAEVDVDLDPQPAYLRIHSRGGRTRRDTADNILLLLDSSGSMRARLETGERLDIAQQALRDLISDVPSDDVALGLRVFGAASAGRRDCSDSALVVPVGEPRRGALFSARDRLQPNGLAPIDYALELAAADLPEGQRNSIVLLTGSVDNCDGDPCATAGRLMRSGRVGRIYVIGLGIDRDQSRKLDCIGEYRQADTPGELKSALREIVRSGPRADQGTLAVFRADQPETWVAGGFLGEKIKLSAGTYDVVIRTEGKSYVWESLEINGNFEATAGRKPPQ